MLSAVCFANNNWGFVVTRQYLARALMASFMTLLLLPAAASAQGDPRAEDAAPAALRALAAAPAAVVAAVDQYEDDDDVAAAREITFWGGSETHTIDSVGAADGWDWDYFQFTAVPGTLYEFETSGVADTAMEIWDHEPRETITWNDDIDAPNGNMGAYVRWRAPAESAGRTYYVCVQGANSVTGAGEYTLQASTTDNPPSTCTVQRVNGRDRFAVAVASANKAFPAWHRAGGEPVTTVVIANGEDAKAADPLAAASLAGVHHAPVLLVGSKNVPEVTRNAINAIRSANGGKVNIYVIGGAVTIPPAVYNSIAALRGTGTCERISGADRYELAAKLADKVTAYWMATYGRAPWRVYVANGENPAAFYDAVAMGPLVYRPLPLLLVRTASVPTSTRARLNGALKDAEVVAVNKAYMTTTVYTGIQADDYIANTTSRFRAAYAVNRYALNHWLVPAVSYAVANKLPDAVTGGSMMGELGGLLLYTSPDVLDGSAELFLCWRRESTQYGYVLGGPNSVNDFVYADLNFLLTSSANF